MTVSRKEGAPGRRRLYGSGKPGEKSGAAVHFHSSLSGHIHIIEEARKHGTVVVGILLDTAVSAWKGDPAVPYEHRLHIFQNVKGVDYVVPQRTLDYTPNLQALRPEFVVHGDNWRTDHQQPVRQRVLDELAKWKGQLFEPAYAEDADPGPALPTPTLTSDIIATCFERVEKSNDKPS